MAELDPDPKKRTTAKIVGFLLLGLSFTMLIAAGAAPLAMVQRIAIAGFGLFGLFWAYRFMKLGRGGE